MLLYGETFKVAMASILANKLRSILTMLGIVIGVGAVITMVALGTGAQRAVQEQIERLGTNLLTIFPGQSFMRGVASGDRVNLTIDDYEALLQVGPAISEVVPQIQSNMQIEYGNRNANISVIGTTANYVPVNNYELEFGRMYSKGDDDSRKRYAVLGSAVPAQLQAGSQFQVDGGAFLGRTISIRGIPFEVIGVLKEKGASGSWNNPDEQILIPLQTAQFRIFGSDRLRQLTVQVAHTDSMQVAMIEIERALRASHGIEPGGQNDFQIRNFTSFLATQEETTRTLTFLLAGIAAVSLVVGGIGIMNIMLVSVTERTREIGLRKALGATKANILFQFMVEAITLCLLGGLVGILAGSGGAFALARLAAWNTQVSIPAIIVAVLFSAATGLVFGVWPARRAARLDPIEALRYE